MFTKNSIYRTFAVLLSILLMSTTASARPLAALLGTGFTYQGKLTNGGAPANGAYDFQFELYNALSSGSQVGILFKDDLTVSNGLFTVQLDFGNVFDGTALYLQISVRPGASGGGYTPLTPRQALTATPYAIYASKAPWTGLTGVPSGFSDGVDNGSTYQNVRVVAKSGGDYTTITAALNSITTNSDTNRWLIYVAPGVYNEQVTMKQYVDIEGAGEMLTKITFTGSASRDTGTLVGTNNAELRFLTAENTGGNDFATAIYNYVASPRLTHITASASGGTDENYGVYNINASSPMMTNVTSNASGGTYSYGVFIDTSSPTMTGVSASASGGTYNYGIFNNSNSYPTMTDVSASASGGTESIGVYNASSSPKMMGVSASASGGTNNYGVMCYSSGPEMMEVKVTASGGTNNIGVWYDASEATINNSVISASGGTLNVGIRLTATNYSYTVRVNNSQIRGDTNTIYSDSEFTTNVGASQLSGGEVFANGGFMTCAGVYDENYDFYASTCP